MLDIHLVTHTHWDREWYLTREQFRLRLVDLIDGVIDLFAREPRFRHFHLDGQTIVLDDYLEVRPDREPVLRELIASGRILVGPWYDMPDEFLVSGEALVRNLARGHRLADRFGGSMPVGYLPDLFGHVAQMPQILSQFGLDNAILWRGFGGSEAEYWWHAPDGSRVLMLHLPPAGYCNAIRLPLAGDGIAERAVSCVEAERRRSRFDIVLLMNGVDHVEPHPDIPRVIDSLAAMPDARAAHSTLPAYVEAVRAAVGGSAEALEAVHGELRGGEGSANLLPGVLSARTYLKQANARVQRELEWWAEPAAAAAVAAGMPYPHHLFDYAWKTLLENHPHDSICGCSIDAVHEENMTRFARAGEVATGLTARALAALAAAVPAGEAETLRVLVFNASGDPSPRVVDGFIDLPIESDEPLRAIDPGALDAPVTFYPEDARIESVVAVADQPGPSAEPGAGRLAFQVLSEARQTTHIFSRYETPWAVRTRRLHVAFWAPDLPPFGYAAYDVGIGSGEPAASTGAGVTVGPTWAENDLIRIDLTDAGSVDLTDKRSGTVYRSCGTLEDSGDVGDEYNYSPPEKDVRLASGDSTDAVSKPIAAGPLRATFQIDLTLRLPAAASTDRSGRSEEEVDVPVSMRVSIDAASPRVTWEAEVDNGAKDHRLRVLFPVGAAGPVEQVSADTAFAIARRAARRETPGEVRVEAPVSAGPLLSFVDTGDETAGVLVLSDGLNEYEVSPGGGSIGLTLLRCVGDLSRADLVTRPSGHAGPGIATPGAQCLGRRTFRFAIEPRISPLDPASPFASARRFLGAPRFVAVTGGQPRLPARQSFLRIDEPAAVVVSAFKAADDGRGVVVRMFNPSAEPREVRVSLAQPIASAHTADLRERPTSEVPVADGAAIVAVGPNRIVTLLLR